MHAAPLPLSSPSSVPAAARPPLQVVVELSSGAALHRLCGEELARGGVWVPQALARARFDRVDVEVVCAEGARFVLPCEVLHVIAGHGTALSTPPRAAIAVDALMSHALFVPPVGDPMGAAWTVVDAEAIAAVLADAADLDGDRLDGDRLDSDRLDAGDTHEDDTLEDVLAAAHGAAPDDTHQDVDDAPPSLLHAVASMTLAEKRHAALHGPRDVRLLLARDRNPALHILVVKNPQFALDDAEALAKMPSLASDALHLLARDWAKTPSMVRSLVKNPKTPLADALALVPKLAAADLRAIAKTGGVRTPVLTLARRLLNG
jgi:hypothetical protein